MAFTQLFIAVDVTRECSRHILVDKVNHPMERQSDAIKCDLFKFIVANSIRDNVSSKAPNPSDFDKISGRNLAQNLQHLRPVVEERPVFFQLEDKHWGNDSEVT